MSRALPRTACDHGTLAEIRMLQDCQRKLHIALNSFVDLALGEGHFVLNNLDHDHSLLSDVDIATHQAKTIDQRRSEVRYIRLCPENVEQRLNIDTHCRE